MTKRGAFTEAEWLTDADPSGMLHYLGQHRRVNRVAGGRRMRLFACACCRQVWHLMTNEDLRRAIEVSERAADGRAPTQELTAAWEAAARVRRAAERQAEAPRATPLPGSSAWRAARLAQHVASAAEKRPRPGNRK
jgi:hypothetical protein